MTLPSAPERAPLPSAGATVVVDFVVGAMAMGLAVARFVSEPEWAKG